MLKKRSAASLLATLLLLMPTPGVQPNAALADDVMSTATAPVLVVHSIGGTITIFSSDEPNVRVSPAAQKVRISRFSGMHVWQSRVMLPERQIRAPYKGGWRSFHLPARQFYVPTAAAGNDGVSIDNPGGDMSIGVPARVRAIFINAESGDVAIEKLRGPYVVSANAGEVRLQNVVGRGLIRTLSGNITLGGVGGDVHIQTASGAVTVRASSAERADVVSEIGPIDWRFARVGAGAYHFRSKEGAIRLGFRPGVAALVDAQSGSGNVLSLFQSGSDASSAEVRFSSPHALSITVNGGGPEITATSMSGDITIGPVAVPQRQ